MFWKKPGKAQNRIGSLIGVGTQITGDIRFVGGLRIDGEVKGDVSATNHGEGTLVVGEQAHIDGKLTAPHLIINGAISGLAISTELVELQPQARVAGNIYYKSITMHPGAVVEGKLVHCKSNGESGDLELVYGSVAEALPG